MECVGHPLSADPLRPPPGPPKAVSAYFNSSYSLDLDEAGDNKYTTCFDVRGPGCCGAILAQVNRLSFPKALEAFAAIRSGVAGMFSSPLAAPGRRTSDYVNAAARAPSAAGSKSARVKAAKERHFHDSRNPEATCLNCGDCNADPYHVLIQCSHPAVVAARDMTTAQLPARIEQLVLHAVLPRPLLRRLEYLGHVNEIARRRGVASNVASLASMTDWQSPDGRFTLFHLLAVATWPLRSVEREDLYLSRSLASVFSRSEIKNHHARPMANFWAGFAWRSVESIFKAWNAAAALPAVPALLFVSACSNGSTTPAVLRRSSRVPVPSRRFIDTEPVRIATASDTNHEYVDGASEDSASADA